MVFAPKLEGGPSYVQPVDQPNAMGAIAGLFNFGLEAATKGGGGGNLNADEKFALDVKEFEANEGIGDGEKWTRDKVRKAIFMMPQHRDKIMGYATDMGVAAGPRPAEVSRDAVAEWSKTPEGVLAAARASDMDPDEADAYIAQEFTNVMAQEAAILKVNRNASQLEAEGKLQDTQWNALKTVQKSAVDNVVNQIVAPAIAAVQNGQSVEVPPELKQIGITFDVLDMNTLPLALLDVQRFMEGQAQKAYSGAYGAESIPPQAWKDEVYGSLKPYLAIAETFDTPQERASAMSAMVEIQAMTELDNQGLGTVMHLLKTLPPDTVKQIYGNIPELMAPLSKIMVPKEGGELFSREEMTLNIQNGSVADAGDAAKAAAVVLGEQMDPNVFHVFKTSVNKSGHGVIDGSTWKTIFSSNIEELNKLNTSDPEFRAEVSDFMVSDIQQTITVIENNLPSNMDLVNVNGRFSVVMTGGTGKSRAEAAMGTAAFTATEINKALKALPSGVDVTALNEKVSSLPLMGGVGKEIQEAVGILNTEPKKSGSPSGGVPKGRGRGTVTASSKSVAEPENWTAIRNGIFAGESGGDYDALFGFSNRAGGKYEGVRLTEMTVDEALEFANPSGEYGNWVKGQVGRVATPMGAYQIVGTTLRAAKAGLGLSGSEVMTPELQDQLGIWIYEQQGTQAWEGYKGPRDSYDPAPHSARAEAGYEAPTAPLSVRSDSSSIDSGVMTGAQALNMPVEAVGGATEGLSAQEVASLVERVKQAPEKAIQVVQEAMGGKPVDPMIMALIEALVGVKR